MATKPTIASQAVEIAELRSRIEELETSLSAKVETLVQSALVTACAVDRTEHAFAQAQREERAAARPAVRPEPIPRPEGFTRWQCDERCKKLRARGYEDVLLAYRAGGFVKFRLANGVIHDTTVQRIGDFLAGKTPAPF